MDFPINSSMTNSQLLHAAHSYIGIPSLLIQGGLSTLFLLIIGLIVSGGESKKFWIIFGCWLVLMIILTVTLVFIPEFAIWITNFLK